MSSATKNTDLQRFIQQHASYVDGIIASAIPSGTPLTEPAHYTLDSGGKRLRPMLTLILATSLDIPFGHIAPLLQAIEMIHTCSLVFDDLPAQDNATMRRGKPAVHRAFNEWTAQLTGLSLLTQAFGTTANLQTYFPAEKVVAVEQYISAVVGMEGLCKGQAMDLMMESGTLAISESNLLEMFHYKTSLIIEASLVPLLILTGRPQDEIAHIKDFAHHAGIVFQIQDDILDQTSTVQKLGKDVRHDSAHTNFVQVAGMHQASQLLHEHVTDAYRACNALPFDTTLLKAMAELFILRKK
jgi:geranylgeranyl pyrophosphate synthase